MFVSVNTPNLQVRAPRGLSIKKFVSLLVSFSLVATSLVLIAASPSAHATISGTQNVQSVSDLVALLQQQGGPHLASAVLPAGGSVKSQSPEPPAVAKSTEPAALDDFLFTAGSGGTDLSASPQSSSSSATVSFRVKSLNTGSIEAIVNEVPSASWAFKNEIFAAADVPVDDILLVDAAVESYGLVDVFVDRKVKTSAFYPSDPDWGFYWGARSAFMPAAWGITRGSPSVKIAVLDSGVAVNDDLPASRVSTGHTLYPQHPARTSSRSGSGQYGSLDAHGTMSAAVAAGTENNMLGTLGTCPRCSIIPVRVISPEDGTALFSSIAAGAWWAASNGADIISMSLATDLNDNVLHAVLRTVHANGVKLVASAGNYGDSKRSYPASWPEVIGVAAHDFDSRFFSFSSRGTQNAFVAAPSCMEAANAFNGVSVFCGTSSSAPFVAGIIGLMLSVNRNVDPMAVLAQTSTPMAGTAHGRVNAHRALLRTLNRSLPTKNPAPDCGFRDVPSSSYYARASCWLKSENITTGFGGRTDIFAPEEVVTRAQMAAFLWRASGSPSSPASCGFRDVPSSSYYARASCWLKSENITTGFGGRTDIFAPDEVVTRAQMAAFLWRTEGRAPANSRCGFRDVPAGTYFEVAACWLAATNVTTGFGGNSSVYAPNEHVARAQMAAFLHRRFLR